MPGWEIQAAFCCFLLIFADFTKISRNEIGFDGLNYMMCVCGAGMSLNGLMQLLYLLTILEIR
jgi:hypothetical protein